MSKQIPPYILDFVTWTITHMQLWQHAWRVKATVSMIFFTQWMQSMEKYATFYSAEMTKAWTNKRNPSSDITLIIEHYDNWFDKQTSSNYLKVSKLIRRLIHCYFFRWIFSASGMHASLWKKRKEKKERKNYSNYSSITVTRKDRKGADSLNTSRLKYRSGFQTERKINEKHFWERYIVVSLVNDR